VNDKKLQEAIHEAKRFLKRAEIALAKMKTDPMASYRCTEAATAERASLDLSRCLAELRRP